MGMKEEIKEKSLEVGLALNGIAMLLDERNYKKIAYKLDIIESSVRWMTDKLEALNNES